MLFSEASFGEIITIGVALFGIGAVAVAQCGGNKRPEKKKLGAQPASSKSKRAISSKSSRSARSQPTVKKGLAQQAQKSRSAKKSKSSKSSRKSKRSAADKKSARSGKTASLKTARGPVKSERSSKEPSTAKEVSAKQALNAKEQNSAANKKNQGVFQSLKDVADSKLYLSQKSLLQGKGTDTVELQMEPRQLKFDSAGGLQKVRVHNPSNVRKSIKVKCSDNNLFRVSPVFALIEPGKALNLYVVRHAGEGKLDKIVILTADVSESAEANPQELFSKIAPETNVPMLVLPLVA